MKKNINTHVRIAIKSLIHIFNNNTGFFLVLQIQQLYHQMLIVL